MMSRSDCFNISFLFLGGFVSYFCKLIQLEKGIQSE